MNVYVVHYAHKHGTDIAVCTTEQRANEVALDWATQEVQDDWDEADRDKFNALSDPTEKLIMFHDIEGNVSYGSTIDVLNREVVE